MLLPLLPTEATAVQSSSIRPSSGRSRDRKGAASATGAGSPPPAEEPGASAGSSNVSGARGKRRRQRVKAAHRNPTEAETGVKAKGVGVLPGESGASTGKSGPR